MSGKSKMVKVPPTVALCDECARTFTGLNPTTEEDHYVSCYCTHNSVFGVFLPELGYWQIQVPVSLDHAKSQLRKINEKQSAYKRAN